ncbi:MAG: hypothetical protein GY945_14725 [Rhodobacteraceae bacterium]|nr:hypothetical protein [Paracoccaceae bacterium]
MATLVAVALAGCSGYSDLERAGAGAAGGALIAGVTSGNLLTGAVIGAGIGALCDDVNLELCN